MNARPPDPGRGAASGSEPEQRQEAQPESPQDTTTTRVEALEAFRQAKAAYHSAVLAVIRGDAWAVEQAGDVLLEINEALGELQRIGAGAC